MINRLNSVGLGALTLVASVGGAFAQAADATSPDYTAMLGAIKFDTTTSGILTAAGYAMLPLVALIGVRYIRRALGR
jgi:hypothetical protein